MKDLEKFIEKKYIQGKSYQFLIQYLQDDGKTLEASDEILSEIHFENWEKRKKTGIKDIFIAIAGLGTFITWTILMFINGEFSGNAIYYISFFIWVPFTNSAYTIFKSKNEFKPRKESDILDSPI